ncbi:isocitrate lyase/PEP mutase family protein [Paraferrimonas sedimenticola]|uniref:Isocitrate lyase-family enzyme n=1 Tax=Paraferrimonas sedimenticola TaxID=375674 RepID=A0AA37W0H3_9GAMM|nr:isocitrate lyase/PEP mutase family protein [Paraferrimonas sedimenticola]GLP96340.1 isocitrate lyase-family enzyme [Paraferrimonas sedimenticola]
MTPQQTLRQRLQQDQVLKAPGVYDGLSALLVEQAGFEAAFLSGACIAFARFGRPDMGLVSMNEVATTISDIRERIEIPLIVDMDTGFGNALNVQRTMRLFEKMGASAMQMEDQLMPKRCGHMAGKQVIPCDEMVGKIHAALDARQDPNTLLIARTDALGVNGFDDAMTRAEKYVEAGADVLFIEAPKDLDQMRQIGETFGSSMPLVHNLVEGGHSPVKSSEELQKLNYRIAIYPAALLHTFVPAARQTLSHIAQTGAQLELDENHCDLNELNSTTGAPELLSKLQKYT